MWALEAEALTKSYRRGALALDRVSLGVRAGSITGLVGPNAAGKSTLMKTWVGFERPTAGRVLVNGVDPWVDRSSALSWLAYVPQRPALYRNLTVADHLDYVRHVRPRFDKSGAKAQLRGVGIPIERRPTALSGGQAALVMLSIALYSGADTLILDEPLASLDPLARSDFLSQLRSAMPDRASTAILSSHIVTDLEGVCDRLILLGIGRVLLDDTVEALLATHRVVTADETQTADWVAVGTIHDGSGKNYIVAKVPHTSPAVGNPATIDAVVKAYLSANRRDSAEPGS